jgi:hypothetical protein
MAEQPAGKRNDLICFGEDRICLLCVNACTEEKKYSN